VGGSTGSTGAFRCSARAWAPAAICASTTWCSRRRSPSGCRGAACTYSLAQKRKVYGCHIVLVSWSSDPTGTWRIPVAFRLWRPQRTCAAGRYQKKTQLVQTMLRELVAAGWPAAYLVGDTAYTGGALSKTATRLGLVWVGTL